MTSRKRSFEQENILSLQLSNQKEEDKVSPSQKKERDYIPNNLQRTTKQ